MDHPQTRMQPKLQPIRNVQPQVFDGHHRLSWSHRSQPRPAAYTIRHADHDVVLEGGGFSHVFHGELNFGELK